MAKVLAERAAWDYAKENKLDIVVIHPSFIIGPVLPPDLCSTASDTLGLLKGSIECNNYCGFSLFGFFDNCKEILCPMDH
jgi:nucleoside-diphosphate-sugar epimerase